MQLDLLQDGLNPVISDNQPALPKKSKKIPSQNITEETTDTPLKPLPESLQPEFLIKHFDELAISEDSDKPIKNPEAFKTISEASKLLGLPQHVLRFWESRFAQIKPLKLAGGRRYYRPDDMEILSTIKNLLYKQGYTIKGAKKAFSLRRKSSGTEVVDIFNDEITSFPEVKQRVLTKKQQGQLSAIREELMGLREALGLMIY